MKEVSNDMDRFAERLLEIMLQALKQYDEIDLKSAESQKEKS